MMFQNCVEDKWGRIYESSSESDNDEDDEDGDGDWDDDDDEELEEEQDGIAEHHDVKNFRLVSLSSFLFLGLQETLCHFWSYACASLMCALHVFPCVFSHCMSSIRVLKVCPQYVFSFVFLMCLLIVSLCAF